MQQKLEAHALPHSLPSLTLSSRCYPTLADGGKSEDIWCSSLVPSVSNRHTRILLAPNYKIFFSPRQLNRHITGVQMGPCPFSSFSSLINRCCREFHSLCGLYPLGVLKSFWASFPPSPAVASSKLPCF